MVLNTVNAITHQNASNNWPVYIDISEYRIQIFDAWNIINNAISIKIYIPLYYAQLLIFNYR